MFDPRRIRHESIIVITDMGCTGMQVTSPTVCLQPQGQLKSLHQSSTQATVQREKRYSIRPVQENTYIRLRRQPGKRHATCMCQYALSAQFSRYVHRYMCLVVSVGPKVHPTRIHGGPSSISIPRAGAAARYTLHARCLSQPTADMWTPTSPGRSSLLRTCD